MSDPVVITVSGEAPAGLVTEQEYNEREASRPASGSPSYVDTEAKLDSALAAGGLINIRGTIDCTTPKVISKAFTTIVGPGHLRFNGAPVDARCLQVWAPNVTLRDFEISSTMDLSTSVQNGINIPALEVDIPHRFKLLRLDVHNFHTCIAKYGGPTTPYTDDLLMEDCYVHTFRYGAYMTFGLRRMTVKRCRMLGKQAEETHTCDGNAFMGNANLVDVLIEDCELGHCGRMGLELTTSPDCVNIRPRAVRTRIVNAGSFGVSFGHSVQGYAEQVLVDGAYGIGFEIAGDDHTGRTKDMLLVGCDVRNVTDPAGGATSGFTIDKSSDVVLLGCRVTNITSNPSNLANGVFIYHSERVAVFNGIFMDGGATGVHLYRGPGPNTSGFHVVQGCTFRHSVNIPNQGSVFVSDINTIVRNNTAFARGGGSMGFAASCNAGAAVQCDSDTPIVMGPFTGSNKVFSVPA